MSEPGSVTTQRDESASDVVDNRLALYWVWPIVRAHRLQGVRLSIGRAPSAVVQLDGPGVSRHHAELYRQGPLYVVRDLASTNGTWLDGDRIEHAPVGPGSVLRIGDWVGVFVKEPENSPIFSRLAEGLFGGAEMASLIAPLKRGASSKLPVLLIGETGTGKERLARAAHDFSGRKGPFLALNCAALPEQLAEAELFGYRRGAFTGAERASHGYFRAANGGTLFLDEMPELSPALQAKLLRVLEDGEVTGLGEPTAISVDVRIVSASQRPLRELVSQGALRQDLAARLGGLELRIPPLAARRRDIAPLFGQFLAHLSGGHPPRVEPRLVEALCLYDWPENVRELELLTRRLLAVHGHESTLARRHLPPELAALNEERPRRASSTIPIPRRDHDLRRVRESLANNGGNVKATAEALGISRQRIYRLLDGDEPASAGGGSQDRDAVG